MSIGLAQACFPASVAAGVAIVQRSLPRARAAGCESYSPGRYGE
jgi:hypothetical protein